MNWVLVALASIVAAQYLVIAFTVVPLLARLATDEPGRGLRLARLGAAAFFVGCALTHVGIAIHAASDTQTPGLDLIELHVLPHVLQIAGGGLFIWLVFTGRIEMSFVGPRAALAERARARLAAIVEHSDDAIVATDAGGRVVDWNAAAGRLYGYDAADIVGRPLATLSPPERRVADEAVLASALAGEVVESREAQRRKKDGTILDVSLTYSPIRDTHGAIVGASNIARDSTERVAAQRRSAILAAAVERLDASLSVSVAAQTLARILVEELGELAVVDAVDSRGRVERLATHVTDAAAERRLWKHHHAADGRAAPLVRAVAASGEAAIVDLADPGRRASAPEEFVEVTEGAETRSLMLAPIVPQRGRTTVVSVVSTLRPFGDADLVLLKSLAKRAAQALTNAHLYEDAQRARASAEQSTRELREAQSQFRTAFQEAPIGVALVSVRRPDRGRHERVNAVLCDITGYDAAELRERTIFDVTHPEDRDAFRALVEDTRAQWQIEQRLVHKNGHPLWVQICGSVVRGQDDEPLQWIVHVLDITDRKRYEGQLQYLADHDALTGLYNRRRLEEEIDRAQQFATRYNEPATLLVVDLDNFKYVNDTFGHALGDEVLGRVADLLRSRTRGTDVVARFGGDEFALVLAHTDDAAAEAVAAHLLDGFRTTPLATVGERAVYVTASVGITPLTPGGELSAQELIVEADVAMYDAKDSGRDRASRGDGQDRPARIRARMTWAQRIRDAIEADGFELWEQPMLSIASNSFDRSELLLRMRGENGDTIPPASFLYIAEQFGQVQAIDRWVIEHAVQLLAERRAAGLDHYFEVNLSGATVSDRDVMEFIAETVRTAPIDPTRLMFEITETAAIVNIERARQFARRLADLGCQFALDDFGAGFGSFYYLKHLPFDCVKIDGDFIKELPLNVTDQLTVQAIVAISRGLGKQTVAEFVGDDETLELLRGYGVDHAQGYHIATPRPARAGPPVVAVP
jgi:diguanylate cyclase (GGDEF)-like protein/PAS domain S-box-containing protein